VRASHRTLGDLLTGVKEYGNWEGFEGTAVTRGSLASFGQGGLTSYEQAS
jgi:hypothetical protein